MKKASYLLLASLIFILAACSKSDTISERPEPAKPIVLTTKQGEKASADNRFAFKMFKEVSALKGANTFFSPLSLNLALGMLYNGASGDTRTEMAQVLGMADFTDTEINEYYQKMIQALLDIDPLTQLGIANSIWYHDGFPVKQPFIDINQKYFDAVVKALDFSKSDAADIINKWCADKTKNRIEEIIEKPIHPDVVMYLINALYFKSKWQFEFKKKDTKLDDFTKENGQTIKANMMEQTTTLPYYSDPYLQCVEMPYGNQAFSMVAILGADNMTIDQLVEYLDNDTWQNIVDNLHERNVHLKLPRFKVECEIPLNKPVENVGMLRIFDKNLADFAHISDTHLFVSDIKQKTFVEVNEEGTEAAAVTVVGKGITSVGPVIPSEPIPFFANRPFLYLIKEKSTGVILFMGRMDEPD
ncbi:MAG: serpin family protein [Bacteroidales bacterium]|nr:serpin family protein [Bacteroidales bacterium]